MAAKMELLKRTDGVRMAPRVVLNPSMSFSFQLPVSMLQKPLGAARNHEQLFLAKSSAAHALHDAAKDDSAHNHSAMATQSSSTVLVRKTEEEEEEEEESWEDRDWSASPAAAFTATIGSATATALPRVIGAQKALGSSVITTTAAAEEEEEEEDEWEEADVPDLPDDFPVLIVNLSRLRDLHFRSDTTGSASTIPMDTEQQRLDFYVTVKATLHDHFDQMTEVLFEQEICIHAHYGTHQQMLNNLQAAFPSHFFALIDYPTHFHTSGLDLYEYLHLVSTPTRWESVNYLKDCLRKCSREISWKFEIILEIEKLAQQEQDAWTKIQQTRSEEIDTLTKLRQSFQAKIGQSNQNQYMLLLKLDDLEKRLGNLLDLYLQEPFLTQAEKNELVDLENDKTPSMQMKNVLDMIVAMVFSRLPRDYSAQPTQEAHFEMLVDYHFHIRKLWKKEFGRLPGRPYTDEIQHSGAVAEDAKEEEEKEEDEEDWEAIAGEDEQEEGQDDAEEEEKEAGTSLSRGDILDGYGADESDSSDGDDEEKDQPQPQRVVASRRTRGKRPGSTRQSATTATTMRSTGSHQQSQQDRDRELEAFMYGNSSSSSNSKSSGSESDEDVEDTHKKRPSLPLVAVQRYAKTGALDLLRRAKEKEGF